MDYGTRPLTYTVAGARAATGLGQTRLYELLGEGVLEGRKAGRRTLILGESLERYVAGLPKADIRTARKAA